MSNDVVSLIDRFKEACDSQDWSKMADLDKSATHIIATEVAGIKALHNTSPNDPSLAERKLQLETLSLLYVKMQEAVMVEREQLKQQLGKLSQSQKGVKAYESQPG